MKLYRCKYDYYATVTANKIYKSYKEDSGYLSILNNNKHWIEISKSNFEEIKGNEKILKILYESK